MGRKIRNIYINLAIEMTKRNIEPSNFADVLDVRIATINDKLTGKYDWKINECKKIKKVFFPDLSLDYLFET